MSYIDEWGKNKPKYLTVFFHQCISSVDAVCEFFDALKNDPTLEKNFVIADADEWNSYYHGNFVASDFIFTLLSEFSPLGQLRGAKYENIFNDIFEMLPTDITQFTKKLSDEITKKAEPLIEEIARLSSIDIQSEINGEVDEGLVEKFREEILSTSEGAFFYLVWAPCVLTYLW